MSVDVHVTVVFNDSGLSSKRSSLVLLTTMTLPLPPELVQTTPPQSPSQPLQEQTPAVPKSGSINSVFQSLSGKAEDIERVNPELHSVIDSFMELELEDGTLDLEDGVPYKAVPKASVPFDAEELYLRLADAEGESFYNNATQEWNDFPAHLDEEHTVMDFLNLLLAAVKAEPGCGAQYELVLFQSN